MLVNGKQMLKEKDVGWGHDVCIWGIKYGTKEEADTVVKVLRMVGFQIDTAYPTSDYQIMAVELLVHPI